MNSLKNQEFILDKNIFFKFCTNLWTKIWGKELPPKEEATRGRSLLKKIYHDLQIKLRIRRFFVSVVILIIFLWCVFGVFGSLLNHPAIVCAGKDVCIYRGAKLPYPVNSQTTAIKLNSGKVLVLFNDVYLYACGVLNKPFCIFNSIMSDSVLNETCQNFEKFVYKNIKKHAGIYDIEKKKFVKAKNPSAMKNSDVFSGNGDTVVILSDSEPVELFDMESGKFVKTDKNIFNEFYKPLNSELYYINQYDKNRLLVLTNKNGIKNYDIKRGRNEEAPLKKAEQAYLMDLESFSFTKLPEFAQKLKFYPMPQDIKVYKSGKIVLPVRNCDAKNYFRCVNKWDHIEIYDPAKNIFVARDSKYLKDNVFDVELPGGDILFINKDSSYYLNNKTNEFVKTKSFESGKYKVGMYMLDKELQKTFNIYLDSTFSGNVKSIKISPSEFLLTCGDKFFVYPYQRNYNGVCKKTLIYDYEKNTVRPGPTFRYPHYLSSIVQLDDKTFLVAGGGSDDIAGLPGKYTRGLLPNRYAQIIKVKD